jgi:hypothetical protein
MGIGRGRAICEYIEIMQISPVRATMRLLIDAPQVICNITVLASTRVDRNKASPQTGIARWSSEISSLLENSKMLATRVS